MGKKIAHRAIINAWITGIGRKPFQYGAHDCLSGLVAPIVKIQTGIDLAAPYRGKYTNFSEGARLLKADGYDSLADMIAGHFRVRPLAMAQFGDVVSLPAEHDGWALGVVLGARLGVLAETGYGTIERRLAKMAFAIE